MHLRIDRGTFDVAAVYTIDALLGGVAEALAGLPGHDHTHLGMDRVGGRSAVVTTWDTEEHARFARDLLGDVGAKFWATHTAVEPPEVYFLGAG